MSKNLDQARPTMHPNNSRPVGEDHEPQANEFVKKLYKMLEDPSVVPIVSWVPQGDCFVVKDTNEFTKSILPRLFKHSNFASFVRQLNKYDFHKVKNTDNPQFGEHSWTFRHPDFHAHRRSALGNIKRKTAPPKSGLSTSTSGVQALRHRSPSSAPSSHHMHPSPHFSPYHPRPYPHPDHSPVNQRRSQDHDHEERMPAVPFLQCQITALQTRCSALAAQNTVLTSQLRNITEHNAVLTSDGAALRQDNVNLHRDIADLALGEEGFRHPGPDLNFGEVRSPGIDMDTVVEREIGALRRDAENVGDRVSALERGYEEVLWEMAGLKGSAALQDSAVRGSFTGGLGVDEDEDGVRWEKMHGARDPQPDNALGDLSSLSPISSSHSHAQSHFLCNEGQSEQSQDQNTFLPSPRMIGEDVAGVTLERNNNSSRGKVVFSHRNSDNVPGGAGDGNSDHGASVGIGIDRSSTGKWVATAGPGLVPGPYEGGDGGGWVWRC